MKRILTFLLAFSCVALSAFSAPTETDISSASEAKWTIAPAFTSQYLFRGVRLAGACFQPGVDHTNGALSVGAWGSFALEDRVSGDSDPEVDIYGSYTFALGKLEIVPGFQVYTYPDAERSNGLYSVTFEPNLAANFEVLGIQVTPKYYYDVMLKGPTYECSASVALPLPAIGTEIDFSASIATFKWKAVARDTDPDVKNWGDYWTIGASIPYQVTRSSSLRLSVLYSEGRNNYYKQSTDPRVPNDAAMGRTAVTLSYSIEL